MVERACLHLPCLQNTLLGGSGCLELGQPHIVNLGPHLGFGVDQSGLVAWRWWQLSLTRSAVTIWRHKLHLQCSIAPLTCGRQLLINDLNPWCVGIHEKYILVGHFDNQESAFIAAEQILGHEEFIELLNIYLKWPKLIK